MIELTKESIRKFKDTIKGLLQEATTNVKGHTRHSNKGKAFNVQSYEREIGTTMENPLGKSGKLYSIGTGGGEFPDPMFARAASGSAARTIVARHLTKQRGAFVSRNSFTVYGTVRDPNPGYTIGGDNVFKHGGGTKPKEIKIDPKKDAGFLAAAFKAGVVKFEK
jgi:hypothetical protein